uniref:KIN17-like protein n=1 Tax=Ananas comosus var. bracteatus TaxID=296719 RepID=A0A6V7NF26_ANACO|nr:unnamed protein product [Ananas comosus var. bracteatus]
MPRRRRRRRGGEIASDDVVMVAIESKEEIRIPPSSNPISTIADLISDSRAIAARAVFSDSLANARGRRTDATLAAADDDDDDDDDDEGLAWESRRQRRDGSAGCLGVRMRSPAGAAGAGSGARADVGGAGQHRGGGRGTVAAGRRGGVGVCRGRDRGARGAGRRRARGCRRLVSSSPCVLLFGRLWPSAPAPLLFLIRSGGWIDGEERVPDAEGDREPDQGEGLQKLRWYCQMCQKQCRDENGFKCHCMSEGHQRQMQVFGQNPDRIVGGFSEEFERAFLDLMRRSHRFSRVASTVVYNEYIADRHHVHMNSTQWATLTEFVKYLGRTGQCKVEDTPKGWFITYIDRDSETLFKDRLKAKRHKADLAEEERQERVIAHQIERAVSSLPPSSSPRPSSFRSRQSHRISCGRCQVRDHRKPPRGKVAFLLQSQSASVSSKPNNEAAAPKSAPKLAFGDEPDSEEKSAKKSSSTRVGASGGGAGLSALDELMREEEKAKEKINRKDYWLCEGIVVKVMSKTLAEKGYYKQKGVVKRVLDKYVGEIEMLESKHVLRVDQEELETVIPQIGGLVRIVNGAYRGSNARLISVDTEKFCAKVQIEKGFMMGGFLKL